MPQSRQPGQLLGPRARRRRHRVHRREWRRTGRAIKETTHEAHLTGDLTKDQLGVARSLAPSLRNDCSLCKHCMPIGYWSVPVWVACFEA